MEKIIPNAAFSFVNGGIGGTTSHYGGARAWKDVLCYRPDIVTVDFSVNDDANEFLRRLIEGTLRFSFCENTTKEELDQALKALKELLPMLRRYTRR